MLTTVRRLSQSTAPILLLASLLALGSVPLMREVAVSQAQQPSGCILSAGSEVSP